MHCSVSNYADYLIPPERVKFFDAYSISSTSTFKIFQTVFLWLLLNSTVSYMPLRKRHCENPIARFVILGDVIKLGAVEVTLWLLLCHVIDADHVAMTDKHVHWKVQNARIQPEILGDKFMDGPSPLFNFLLLHCAETDSIPPKVAHLSEIIY